MGTSVSFGDYSPGVLPVTIVVRTAYFAQKKTEDILEETTEEYTVVSGDNLSKIAGNYEGVSYQDIMEENGLTSTVISVGDTLSITSRTKTGERTSFEKIKNGNVGDEVYIVAEHFGIVNSIQVTLKEKEALLTDGGTLPVLQDESEITTIELCEPEEENLKGTHRYAKVKLRPKEDETLEEWREKLGEKEVMGYTDGQRSISPESYDRMITKEGWEPEYGEAIKSLLSIEVEAQAEGEITYRGTDKSNVFLNEEGEWFELGGLKEGWSIEVHLYDDRSEMGYGVLVLLNGNGEEYWRTIVRGQGFSSKIGGSRTQKMGDTPTGTYKFEQWRKDGSSTIYGSNSRLDMTYESGEAKAAGREEIQIHGGRQADYNNPYLWNTGGCLRVFDDAIKTLKEKIEELNSEDIEDYYIYVRNDLEYDSDSEKYFIPSDSEKLNGEESDEDVLEKGIVNQKYYRNESNYYTDMLDN
ncbi:LysM peptidoglycan-binding domain-containing protein [Sinomicrobium sp. M5D2P9]